MTDCTLLVDKGEIDYMKYWITLILSPVPEFNQKAAWMNFTDLQVKVNKHGNTHSLNSADSRALFGRGAPLCFLGYPCWRICCPAWP